MIKINNLSFSYSGKKPYQLNDINLTLPENEFISIVGENGSSKTTLLKLLLGYLKPIKGNIEINLNSVGYVPQKVDNFNSQFSITVYEVLKVHLKTLKIKDKGEIDRVLSAVNMQGVAALPRFAPYVASDYCADVKRRSFSSPRWFSYSLSGALTMFP